jgi:hypothetical protein
MLHVVMASNSDWVVPAGLDGERRFAVFEVSRAAQGDRDRFLAIHKQMREGGLAAMLYDLLLLDLNGWHPRDEVPQTVELLAQKLRSMSEIDEWWVGVLEEGVLPGDSNGTEPWTETKQAWSQPIYEDYLKIATGIGARRRMSRVHFGRELKRLVPGLEKFQRRASQDDIGLTVDLKGRAVAYRFPPLAACRDAMDSMLGGKMDWESADDEDDEPSILDFLD